MEIIILNYIKSFLGILNHPLNRNSKFKTISRIIWWKINQLFFHLPVVVSFGGMKIICPPKSSFGSLIIYCHFPEYAEMQFLEKILKPNSVFIDVGANIGAYTILAASKIKTGKIYSFEPVQVVLDTLYQNVRINNLEKIVTIVEKVVSDNVGQERFISQSISEYSHIVYDKASNGAAISSVRLDDFCKLKKITYIELIKIDVEGAELKVLKGLGEYLSSGKVKNLIVELNKKNRLYETSSNEIIEYLKKLNFRIYRLDEKVVLKEVINVNENQTINVVATLNS